MKLPAIFITLLLSTFGVMAQDSKNILKVKINHDFGMSTDRFGGTKKKTLQFVYDTREVLIISNRPESEVGIAIKRTEVTKFKKLLDKMIKFGSAIHENKITGVKKIFEDKSQWTSNVDEPPRIDMSETGDPSDKTQIKVTFNSKRPAPNGRYYYGTDARWTYLELEELGKIFDKRQKEAFKKYDLLKALND